MKKTISINELNETAISYGGLKFLEYDDHCDQLDIVKDYLVEECDYSYGGSENTLDDDTDLEIKGNNVIVDIYTYDDSNNPDFDDED